MKKTFQYAFKRSIPIFISWVPVALAYGVLMASAGYNFLWTGGVSLLVHAGSLQFLMVSFFTGAESYLTGAVLSLLLNSRHIFYGLPFIEKFREFGGWKYFLIYSLSDENFSLHCSHDIGEGINEKYAYVFTAVLLVSYWMLLSMMGALIGSLIPFDTTGIDFALTALFIIILMDQLKGSDTALPALLAFGSSIVCLAVIGAQNFILPSLVITVGLLVAFRKRLDTEDKEAA